MLGNYRLQLITLEEDRMKIKLLQLPIIAFLGLVLTGCSLTYDLNPSTGSAPNYDLLVKKNLTIQVVDDRNDKEFAKGITGLKGVAINIGNVDNPIVWLAQAMQAEFDDRGISVEIVTDLTKGQSPDFELRVIKYQIISSRTSGFHPYVAYHSFAGNLQATNKDNKIMSYFLYGKTPVWVMSEVQEPCFDMPASILLKEIVSKINHIALQHSMSDEQVMELTATAKEKVKSAEPDAYLAVIDLGGTNNIKAMEPLIQFANGEDVLIRACALSAMGTLGADGQFEFLKEKYREYIDIDRFMALKSIGDIGTPEAIKFLRTAKEDLQYQEEYGFKFSVDLYLEATQ